MGNLAKGVRSESANVGAQWPERNNLADAQSLKPRPASRSGFCSRGMAKAPSTTAGMSFNNSRRLMVLNLRLSVRGFISAFLAGDKRTQMRFANQQKVTTGRPWIRHRQFKRPGKRIILPSRREQIGQW